VGVRYAQAVRHAGGGGGNSEGHVGVLKCLNNDKTQKLCVPPVGVNAAAVVEPTFDCRQKYNAALGQIPTDAEFTPASSPANGYILNNGDPAIKEGYWPKSTPDDPTTDNVLNGKSHLGFFNGIAPNDITNVELTTGLEILVRVWKPGATATALPWPRSTTSSAIPRRSPRTRTSAAGAGAAARSPLPGAATSTS